MIIGDICSFWTGCLLQPSSLYPSFTVFHQFFWRIIVMYSIEQGWPKCGPPKIFSSPCVKFWMHNLAIYVWKYPKCTSLCKKKLGKKIFLRPQYNISMKFGLPEKKSGHPWYRRSDFEIVIYNSILLSLST